MELILASKSPRRRELLSQIVPAFSCIPAKGDEVFTGDDIDEALLRVARAKGKEVFVDHPESAVLSADTIVVDGEQILQKPASKEEAFATLRQLSGRWHAVKTGTALIIPEGADQPGKAVQEEDGLRWTEQIDEKKRQYYTVCTTMVHFRKLSDEEIQAYVDLGTCLDKAGSYGIQDVDFVDAIDGSFTNVVGLPCELVEIWMNREKFSRSCSEKQN
ncbi:Maf family protein [Allobaculum mucilyticum]|uniref:Maf family protein n=1 Tax=Allobaculum mucilyticum TaxID=2834459 RepID=UPI001E37D221|nr:Maf family protein [Allobaculum mucilyticum]UNT96616.1 Maf family protein [Allobaculum mucilyticum]